jgi:chemotaxis protein CheD
MNPRFESAEQAAEGEPVRRLYLYPGQVFVTAEATVVTTILGSCIAVCLWDAKARVAGLNHFLLPNNPRRGHENARYGNTSIEELVQQMIAKGGSVSRLTARVIGGASMMRPLGDGRLSIGEQNSSVAHRTLSGLGIAVSAEQTGGLHGRKLLFHTGNGCAYSKEIGA